MISLIKFNTNPAGVGRGGPGTKPYGVPVPGHLSGLSPGYLFRSTPRQVEPGGAGDLQGKAAEAPWSRSIATSHLFFRHILSLVCVNSYPSGFSSGATYQSIAW